MIRDIQNLSSALKVAAASGTQFNRVEYGYLGEINTMRGLSNADYIMFLLPPSSTMPDAYKNIEEVKCTFHCYTTLKSISGTPPTNSNQALEYFHDILKQKFIQTISNLTKDAEHKYVLNSPIEMERTSREFNQEYVGLICTLTISMFSTCLPFSNSANI